MGFNCGIIGLPNVGKSTIFNALTSAGAECAPYPFCTIEPNVGIVPVPDERLNRLASLLKPAKVTPTTLRFVDIAGLVKGASRGEGLGNQFLSHIRNVDAVAHVVRLFSAGDVSHVQGKLDPLGDIEVIETELLLADLDVAQRQRDKISRAAKSGDAKLKHEVALLDRLIETLNSGKPLREIKLSPEEEKELSELAFISTKPVLIVANVSEEPQAEEQVLRKSLEDYGRQRSIPLVAISGKLEMELAAMEPAEREEFMRELGLTHSGLEHLVLAGYRLLQLVTFYTTVGPELRAWTVPAATPAPQAAGKIHTDMERGFIKAEVIHFDEFIKAGSEHTAREQGLLRIEGRDYLVQDGDIIHFRFNV